MSLKSGLLDPVLLKVYAATEAPLVAVNTAESEALRREIVAIVSIVLGTEVQEGVTVILSDQPVDEDEILSGISIAVELYSIKGKTNIQ